MQRGRSPFAGRIGEEVASEAFALHDDGRDPEGPASAPFDGEGVPRRRTALIEGGRLRAYLYDTYTASARRRRLDRQRRARRLPLAALGLALQPRRRPRRALASSELLAEAGEGVYVTDVAGLHSGVNPVSGVFSVGASGRAIRGGELAEPVREFTIASDLVSMLRRRSRRRRGGPLGAVRRLGQHAAAADRRDDASAAPERGLTPSPLLDCGRSSTPEEELRRDQG